MSVHQGQPVLRLGPEFQQARRAVILLHGRGGTAESMLPLAEALELDGTRFLIPQAAGSRWYPETAFGPLEANEPDLSSALQVVAGLIAAALQAGMRADQVALGGFSQGACLAAESLVRSPGRYGGLFVFSGALIGPPDQPRLAEGNLLGTPAFVGGGDQDPWVSPALTSAAARVLRDMGAEVEHQVYPGMGHTINLDEISRVRALLQRIN